MSFGPFRVGDSPANQIAITIEDDAQDDLSDYTTCSAVLYDGSGLSVATFAAVAIEGGVATFEFPSDPFATAGVYALAPTVLGSGGHRLQLASIRFVVEPQLADGWHTLASLRAGWPDAPWQDELAYELLEIAKQQVLAYAPALVANEDGSFTIPTNYRKGQSLQARNTWNATKVDAASGALGDDTFQIQPRPLDWFVKQVLRPARPLGFVG